MHMTADASFLVVGAPSADEGAGRAFIVDLRAGLDEHNAEVEDGNGDEDGDGGRQQPMPPHVAWSMHEVRTGC